MKQVILSLTILLGFIPLSFAEQPRTVTVTKVIDGDTIELDTGEKVRLIGIDTPEKYNSKKLRRDAERSDKDIKTIRAMGQKEKQVRAFGLEKLLVF